eukprot:GHVT01025922.1.p1 GENE.GHVT01025922.1~~GHVT01025922.1.p1  ORF type:complete len:732 (+),score=48.37 GHVT01025922.1:859-3054(+)
MQLFKHVISVFMLQIVCIVVLDRSRIPAKAKRSKTSLKATKPKKAPRKKFKIIAVTGLVGTTLAAISALGLGLYFTAKSEADCPENSQETQVKPSSSSGNSSFIPSSRPTKPGLKARGQPPPRKSSTKHKPATITDRSGKTGANHSHEAEPEKTEFQGNTLQTPEQTLNPTRKQTLNPTREQTLNPEPKQNQPRSRRPSGSPLPSKDGQETHSQPGQPGGAGSSMEISQGEESPSEFDNRAQFEPKLLGGAGSPMEFSHVEKPQSGAFSQAGIHSNEDNLLISKDDSDYQPRRQVGVNYSTTSSRRQSLASARVLPQNSVAKKSELAAPQVTGPSLSFSPEKKSRPGLSTLAEPSQQYSQPKYGGPSTRKADPSYSQQSPALAAVSPQNAVAENSGSEAPQVIGPSLSYSPAENSRPSLSTPAGLSQQYQQENYGGPSTQTASFQSKPLASLEPSLQSSQTNYSSPSKVKVIEKLSQSSAPQQANTSPSHGPQSSENAPCSRAADSEVPSNAGTCKPESNSSDKNTGSQKVARPSFSEMKALAPWEGKKQDERFNDMEGFRFYFGDDQVTPEGKLDVTNDCITTNCFITNDEDLGKRAQEAQRCYARIMHTKLNEYVDANNERLPTVNNSVMEDFVKKQIQSRLGADLENIFIQGVEPKDYMEWAEDRDLLKGTQHVFIAFKTSKKHLDLSLVLPLERLHNTWSLPRSFLPFFDQLDMKYKLCQRSPAWLG